MTVADEFQAVLDRYVRAYREGDADGCAAVFAEDAEMISPYGPPARGRDAIRAAHADWVRDGAAGKSVTVLRAGADGTTGWCLARFSEGDVTGDGISLSVLTRDAAGDWQITICSLNAVDGA